MAKRGRAQLSLQELPRSLWDAVGRYIGEVECATPREVLFFLKLLPKICIRMSGGPKRDRDWNFSERDLLDLSGRLRAVSFDGVKFLRQDLLTPRRVTQLGSLTSLSLNHTRITNVGVCCVASIIASSKNFTSLRIHESAWTTVGKSARERLQDAIAFSRLEEVYLSGIDPGRELLLAVVSTPTLRRLHVEKAHMVGGNVTGPLLRRVRKLEKLRALHLPSLSCPSRVMCELNSFLTGASSSLVEITLNVPSLAVFRLAARGLVANKCKTLEHLELCDFYYDANIPVTDDNDIESGSESESNGNDLLLIATFSGVSQFVAENPQLRTLVFRNFGNIDSYQSHWSFLLKSLTLKRDSFRRIAFLESPFIHFPVDAGGIRPLIHEIALEEPLEIAHRRRAQLVECELMHYMVNMTPTSNQIKLRNATVRSESVRRNFISRNLLRERADKHNAPVLLISRKRVKT